MGLGWMGEQWTILVPFADEDVDKEVEMEGSEKAESVEDMLRGGEGMDE